MNPPIIVNGLPIPPLRTKPPVRAGYGRTNKYYFHLFDVGDSAFYTGNVPSIENASRTYGRMSHKRFTTRRLTEGGMNGVRIWRVK